MSFISMDMDYQTSLLGGMWSQCRFVLSLLTNRAVVVEYLLRSVYFEGVTLRVTHCQSSWQEQNLSHS
jgi:hypothetical protein